VNQQVAGSKASVALLATHEAVRKKPHLTPKQVAEVNEQADAEDGK
jgi:hypothetical protein